MDQSPNPTQNPAPTPALIAPGTLAAIPGLEALMDAAWRAAECEESGGWVLRAASGVTQRANSVWTRDPGEDPPRLIARLREARLWYRDRRLPLIFQSFDGPRSAALNAVLDAEGFTRQSETLVMVRPSGTVPGGGSAGPDPAVEITPEPTGDWLDLWWSVDGRGGSAELAVARGILEGCPSLYALVRDDDGVAAAVARLAMPGTAPALTDPGPVVPGTAPAGPGWGGLYCMATRPDARRRGYGGRIVRALLREGDARGLEGYWLLVMASNAGARDLYAQAGFLEACRYLYRQERPKRHLTGC
jgi:ribosomal protein S18 acetylase RimI-like enzyme